MLASLPVELQEEIAAWLTDHKYGLQTECLSKPIMRVVASDIVMAKRIVYKYGLPNALTRAVIEKCPPSVIRILIERGSDKTKAFPFAIGLVKHALCLDRQTVVEWTVDIAPRNHYKGGCGPFGLAKLLIERGVPVDSDNHAALRQASAHGDVNFVQWLVDNGAAVTRDALEEASANGHLGVVELLVRKGCKGTFEFDLWQAAGYGHLGVVKFFVNEGTNLHEADYEPLSRASECGQMDVVRYLVETAGADVHIPDGEPIVLASSNGHLSVVQYLVHHGARVHAQNDSSLYLASVHGHLEIVEYLLSRGAEGYDIALLGAVKQGRWVIAETLFERGGRIGHEYPRGQRTMLSACSKGDYDLVKLMLKYGACDVEAIDRAECEGQAIERAAYEGHCDIVQLLLDHGCGECHKGLMSAIDQSHFEIFKRLSSRVDLESHGIGLRRASARGRTEMVQFLIDLGEGMWDYFDDALDAALMNEHMHIAKTLMERLDPSRQLEEFDGLVELVTKKLKRGVQRDLTEKVALLVSQHHQFTPNESYIHERMLKELPRSIWRLAPCYRWIDTVEPEKPCHPVQGP